METSLQVQPILLCFFSFGRLAPESLTQRFVPVTHECSPPSNADGAELSDAKIGSKRWILKKKEKSPTDLWPPYCWLLCSWSRQWSGLCITSVGLVLNPVGSLLDGPWDNLKYKKKNLSHCILFKNCKRETKLFGILVENNSKHRQKKIKVNICGCNENGCSRFYTKLPFLLSVGSKYRIWLTY